MTFREHLQRYLRFALTWTPGLCLLFTLAWFQAAHFWQECVVSVIIGEVSMALCYWGAALVSYGERRVYRWRGWVMQPRAQWVRSLWGLLFMLPGMQLGFELVSILAPRLGIAWAPPEFGSYRNGVLLGLFSVGFFLIIELFKEGRIARERTGHRIRELENASMRAQIGALTAQMNPHLLFNALNSIASMIQTDPEAAEQMTVGLAGLYRRVLAAARRDAHTLADELELVGAYLEVERGRFGARVAYDLEIGAEVDARAETVPVLCLQPFVENAVKHGLLSRAEGGRLWVRARRTGAAGAPLELEVEDDGVGVGQSTRVDGSGTALVNCRERLALLYGDAASVRLEPRAPRGTRVVLRLPALPSTAPASGAASPASGAASPASGAASPASGAALPAPTSASPASGAALPAPTAASPAPTAASPAPTAALPAPTAASPRPLTRPRRRTP